MTHIAIKTGKKKTIHVPPPRPSDKICFGGDDGANKIGFKG